MRFSVHACFVIVIAGFLSQIVLNAPGIVRVISYEDMQ